MKRLGFLLSVLTTLAACSQVQPPATDATASLEPQTLGTAADDRGKELAFSPSIGALYVAGITKGSLDSSNRGGNDIYLRRYNRNKTVAWTRQIASSANDIVKDIAADASGQLYVGGRQGDLCFHSKYRADGLLLWKHTYSFCSNLAMAVDDKGNIFLAKNSKDPYGIPVYELRRYDGGGVQIYSATITNDFGYQTLDLYNIAVDSAGNAYVHAAECDDDCLEYIQKVSPNGNMSYDSPFAMPPTEYAYTDTHYRDLEVVGDALYAIGDKNYYVTPDENTGVYKKIFESDILIVKYALDGTTLWQRTFGTKVRDVGTTVTADTAGNVYAVGVTRGSLRTENAGADDILMRKLSAAGSTLWTKQFGSASYDQVNDAIAYSSKELYLTGMTSGALEGGSYHGRKDAFLLRRDGSGNRVWTDQ